MSKFFLFLIINFGALAIGSLLMGNPSTNEWYNSQNQAPWTPPGWVFGAAWFTIMFCFAIYMYKIANVNSANVTKVAYPLFALQFILNVSWNPIFFKWELVLPGLIVISLLTILIGWFLFWGKSKIGIATLWVLPYFIWLVIATSLNGYIYFNN